MKATRCSQCTGGLLLVQQITPSSIETTCVDCGWRHLIVDDDRIDFDPPRTLEQLPDEWTYTVRVDS